MKPLEVPPRNVVAIAFVTLQMQHYDCPCCKDKFVVNEVITYDTGETHTIHQWMLAGIPDLENKDAVIRTVEFNGKSYTLRRHW